MSVLRKWIDNAGDKLGRSGFAKHKKAWFAETGYALTRDIYNYNTNRIRIQAYCELLKDLKNHTPLYKQYKEGMNQLSQEANMHTYATFRLGKSEAPAA